MRKLFDADTDDDFKKIFSALNAQDKEIAAFIYTIVLLHFQRQDSNIDTVVNAIIAAARSASSARSGAINYRPKDSCSSDQTVAAAAHSPPATANPADASCDCATHDRRCSR